MATSIVPTHQTVTHVIAAFVGKAIALTWPAVGESPRSFLTLVALAAKYIGQTCALASMDITQIVT